MSLADIKPIVNWNLKLLFVLGATREKQSDIVLTEVKTGKVILLCVYYLLIRILWCSLLHVQCYLSPVQLCGANLCSPFYASTKTGLILQCSQAKNQKGKGH